MGQHESQDQETKDEEIERKWDLRPCKNIHLVDEVFKGRPLVHIVQFYLRSTEDGEVRLRSETPIPNGQAVYTQTYRSRGDRNRKELNVPVPVEMYTALKPLSTGEIVKVRQVLPGPNGFGLTFKEFALDSYLNAQSGLSILEAEFRNNDDAERFVLPTWAEGAIEVTALKEYKNINLATSKSIPPIPRI